MITDLKTKDKSIQLIVIELLDDIQKNLADYQNEIGIGTMDNIQWQQTFVDRVIASITSYESFSTKTGQLPKQKTDGE